jgi:hypothetical protein
VEVTSEETGLVIVKMLLLNEHDKPLFIFDTDAQVGVPLIMVVGLAQYGKVITTKPSALTLPLFVNETVKVTGLVPTISELDVIVGVVIVYGDS